jgi:uncharacterized protein (TIGR02246 family)
MTRDEHLLEELAVAKVLAQYCRALDDRRYDDVAALFTDDAVFETMGQSLHGRAEIRRFFPSGEPLERPESIHLLSNVVVAVEGTRAAVTSDWSMLERDDAGTTRIVLAGRYDDLVVSGDDGRWRIARRRVSSLARKQPIPPEVTP